MKSRAHIFSHPLHPILIAFPIGFLTGALIFDVLALMNNSGAFWQTGEYLLLAGIISTIVAAVPGVVDYLYTVPPDSSAKKRATRHALLNLSHLILFGTAYFIRLGDDPPRSLITGLEALGTGLMMAAGWLGGTLVHRNQIGVDPRYAYAGKWNEAHFGTVSGPVIVALADELKPGQMKLLHLLEKRIVLGRTDQGYVAFDDRCTHRGGSLAAGMMICGFVQCPWHGSQFSCSTGEVKAGPATEKIAVYPVRETDGRIFLDL
jgi:nitrite reductase/ring-hydroxylating ferredoxin subunit/uncharacterized membrane protein